MRELVFFFSREIVRLYYFSLFLKAGARVGRSDRVGGGRGEGVGGMGEIKFD